MIWPPPARDILTMPVEELALVMLRHISSSQRREHHRNSFVGINQLTTSRGLEYHRQEVLDAVNEAWDWLFVNGLTAELLDKTPGWRVLTRKGRTVAASPAPSKILGSERLLAITLHESIEAKARIQFSIGEYEAAVFVAFKELEVRVRQAGGFPDKVVGDDLMRLAFTPNGDGGPLLDRGLHPGEQRAIMDLYAGAMGAFKNPASHRPVDYGEPEVAAEAVLLADLLHRLLDRFIASSAEST